MPDTSAPAPAVPVDLVDLTDPADLTRLHADVLARSFPPAELISLADLLTGCASGELYALGGVRDGRLVAGAVGSGSTPGGVVLLTYLAIAPGERGGGIGATLLDGAVSRWVARHSPAYVLAEVEHPGHHTASIEHGDPVARFRFYARHGARVLAVPYFQPGMGPGAPRVPALALVTLHVDDAVREGPAGPDGRERVSAPPLRAFLEENLRRSEGALHDDAATRALLASVAGAWVDLVSPERLADVPVGLLPES